MASTYNILMYSHDTYGLGHIRRTMAIATHLLDRDVNILILTGSPIVGRFNIPMGIDFVRMPGMIKQSNTVYLPHSIKVNAKHAIRIRKNIITATAKTFDPHIFIVDKVPLGLKGEILPTLKWFKSKRPDTRIILGLRDILDEAESTRQEWKKKDFFSVLRDLYSEIWVYGDQEIYDPVSEYAIPGDVADKTRFTGYIPRPVPPTKYFQRNPDGGPKKCKYVVVTTGGGGDGYAVLDTWLTMLEKYGDLGFKTLMISGPFLAKDLQDQLTERARKLGVRHLTFIKNIEKKLAGADLVVSMGGYNTVCEVLSLKRPTLLVPREDPRKEQLIRAEAMAERGLVDFIRWEALSPELMREKALSILESPQPYLDAMNRFSMTGLEVMRSRVADFKKEA